MRIIKPDNLGVIVRSANIDKRAVLSVAACACFTLDTAPVNRLLNEQDMWPVIEAALSPDELFDFGIPKIRGEYLVYGGAFAPKPVRGMEVSVHVGGLEKTLAVFGDRHWTVVGPQEPEPFTHMPINYGNAFGGPDFPENPLGKGSSTDGTGKHPLPNIQDPRHLVGSSRETPKPVGFTAYPVTWPQRHRYLGRVDENWLRNDWPHFPGDTNWEFFNTAPEDQRLPAFFTGDEKIEIAHMHPGKPLIQSTLPGLRARIFAQRRERAGDIFLEAPCRAETLWLFPDREVGILLYRGTIAVADEDCEDVLHLYLQWESLRKPPKTGEEYRRMFEAELAPAEIPAAAEEEPPPEPSPVSPPPPAPPALHPELAALLKDAQDFEARTAAMLKKAGLDPDAAVKQFLPVAEPAAAGSLEELTAVVAAVEKQTAALMKKFNISAADVEKALAPQPAAPAKTADALIAELRQAGIRKPEIEAQIKEAERMAKEAAAAVDDLEKKKAAPAVPEVPAASPSPSPPPAGASVTVEEVMGKYGRRESLGGLDLSGLDFSERKMPGADFTGADLTGALFMAADLTGAVFKDAILKQADFTGADLTGADLEQVDASEGRFSKSRLNRARLRNADFTQAVFSDADLTGADASGAVFANAAMERINAHKIIAVNALFAKANLTDADLMEGELTAGDFSGAFLTHCSFHGAKADGLRLDGATGDHVKFGYSSLKSSRADKDTVLTDARFTRADFTDSCWEGARLLRAQMMIATMDRADFSNCDLTGSIMILTTAREAKFMKANLNNANLSGMNLFKGSLRKATLVRTDLKYANLYGVDFYQARIQRINLHMSNINKTLLQLWGTSSIAKEIKA